MKKFFISLFTSKSEKKKEKESQRIAIRRLLGISSNECQLISYEDAIKPLKD